MTGKTCQILLWLWLVLLIVFSIIGAASYPVTMMATITSVPAIGMDEQGNISGDAVPVPTDDGSVNF